MDRALTWDRRRAPFTAVHSIFHDGKLLSRFAASRKIAQCYCPPNADGSLDDSFDPGAGATGSILSMALQPDGKIIIAGHFDRFNRILVEGIARLNPDGSLDKSFKSYRETGVAVNNLTVPMTVTLQPDGRILLAGDSFSSVNGADYHLRQGVARVNTDGTLDTSFDAGAGFYVGERCCDRSPPCSPCWMEACSWRFYYLSE